MVRFNITEFVKPICLPYGDDVKEDYRKGQNGKDLETHVAGWGATDARGNYYIQ